MRGRRHVVAVLAAAAAALLPAHAGQAQQKPVFRVNTDLVRVDVLVTDRGRPVMRLTAADFELKDNDVPQDIRLMTEAERVHVVLTLDISGSVAGARLDGLKRASRSLVTTLRPADLASLLTFDERVVLRVDATHDAADIVRALDAVKAGGRTALCDALYAGLSLVAPDTGRSLLLLFSDGGENASFLSREAVMASVRRSMATIYVIGAKGPAGTSGNAALLREVADSGGGNLLWAESDAHLPAVFAEVFNEFRSRYLLTYSPTGVRRDDGWHRISVTLKGKTGKVKARPGYFATATR